MTLGDYLLQNNIECEADGDFDDSAELGGFFRDDADDDGCLEVLFYGDDTCYVLEMYDSGYNLVRRAW